MGKPRGDRQKPGQCTSIILAKKSMQVSPLCILTMPLAAIDAVDAASGAAADAAGVAADAIAPPLIEAFGNPSE